MRQDGRERGTGVGGRLLACMLVAASLLPAAILPALAQTATEASGRALQPFSVTGSEPAGHGRLVLGFQTPAQVSVRASGSVLVVNFDRPVEGSVARLAAELPSYVSVARIDPDGRAIRLALRQRVRTNVMEAGERVFIDLLPDSWAGIPPGLPQDVVSELARRAREAEARIRVAERRTGSDEARTELAYTIGTLPTLSRIALEPPRGVDVGFRRLGNVAEVTIGAALRIEPARLRASLPGLLASVEADEDDALLRIRFTIADGVEVEGFRDEDNFVLDLRKVGQAAALQVSAQAAAPDAAPSPADLLPPLPTLARISAPAPLLRVSGIEPAGQVPLVAAEPDAAVDTGPVRPLVKADADGVRIAYSFPRPVAAAAFVRHGVVTLAFETAQEVAPIAEQDLPAAVAASAGITRASRSLAVIRLRLARETLVRLSPEGSAWTLSLGENAPSSSQPLAVERTIGADGRTMVRVPLAAASGVHWIEDADTGERVALATAYAPAQGISRSQRFVEFRLPVSAHGVAVVAEADDVVVRPESNAIAISREEGLTLSQAAGRSASAETAGFSVPLVFTREMWSANRTGAVREGWRARADAAAVSEVARGQRTRARMQLAEFLIVNDIAAEAVGILDAVAMDDANAATGARYLLLKALASIRMHRNADAAALLGQAVLADVPEAALWRALLDARARRWQAALIGLQRNADIIDAYPDALQGVLRPALVRAAIEMRDLAEAERALERLAALPPEDVSPALKQLLRARLDEASGLTLEAIRTYDELVANATRPIAAEARLRSVMLSIDSGKLSPEDALAALETLSMVWRGDEIELRAISELASAYARSGRWRDAFHIARHASRFAPNHPLSRRLHDEMAERFEALFLDGKGDSLGRLEALALYFDFKEYTPPGRRGDELVRQLAERLAELDLLEQAGDLLEHQVDNRLNGAARAAVATRLAVLRLMEGKAAQALEALQKTRLAELPVDVKRARLLLEARALSDLSRTDLAIEMLEGESGVEVERLRADIFWQGRRWREAGEAFERILGERWRGPEPLAGQDRLDAMRAAIAYGLADEVLSLDRLRGKFAAKMADSADATNFAFLTATNARQTQRFREIARSIASANTLSEFLAEYRKRYPDQAGLARNARADAG